MHAKISAIAFSRMDAGEKERTGEERDRSTSLAANYLMNDHLSSFI
jgi:hypothetical protein